MSSLLRAFSLSAAVIAATLVAPVFAQDQTPSTSQQRMKSCNAAAAAQNLKGDARKGFMSDCLSGKTAPDNTNAQPGAAPQAQQSAPKTQPPANPPAAKATGTTQPPAAPQKNPAAAGAALGAGQYASEADARRHCPTDQVVWANTDSRIYHFSGNKSYGNTKAGAYMCQRDSESAGFRAAKNETPPNKKQ